MLNLQLYKSKNSKNNKSNKQQKLKKREVKMPKKPQLKNRQKKIANSQQLLIKRWWRSATILLTLNNTDI
jgi:hypothetical protein